MLVYRRFPSKIGRKLAFREVLASKLEMRRPLLDLCEDHTRLFQKLLDILVGQGFLWKPEKHLVFQGIVSECGLNGHFARTGHVSLEFMGFAIFNFYFRRGRHRARKRGHDLNFFFVKSSPGPKKGARLFF
jgi:hypothetical protein